MWKITLALAVGLGACHSSMMNVDEMRGYVDDTRRETNRHLHAIRISSTLDGVDTEMSRHRDDMRAMMLGLDATMADMRSHCAGGGLDEMRAMHGDLDGEMAQHLSAMNAIADLHVAVVETERHAGAMMATMDGMEGAMEGMCL